MKLATLDNNTLDGQLIVVSKDQTKAVEASSIAPNLITAVRSWDKVKGALESLYTELNEGKVEKAFAFDAVKCKAPLPIAPQWCDGSAFLNHGNLMEKAFNIDPIADKETIPLMYQGASDDLLSAREDIPFRSSKEGIDFEGEFGVIVAEVPMNCDVNMASSKIILLTQINDWSLRVLAPREMKTGFGFFQSKPSCSFAPIVITPNEIGEAWDKGRVQLDLHVLYNDQPFGHANGREMNFSFEQLICHAAATRKLKAGTIIGSGTVSSVNCNQVGSSCIAEKRVLEMLSNGVSTTPFMEDGDRVTMYATIPGQKETPFGTIDQQVRVIGS